MCYSHFKNSYNELNFQIQVFYLLRLFSCVVITVQDPETI